MNYTPLRKAEEIYIDKEKNKTPLYYAAESNSTDMVKLLISHGAFANIKTIIY